MSKNKSNENSHYIQENRKNYINLNHGDMRISRLNKENVELIKFVAF